MYAMVDRRLGSINNICSVIDVRLIMVKQKLPRPHFDMEEGLDKNKSLSTEEITTLTQHDADFAGPDWLPHRQDLAR